jgi:hypothetical protein
MLHHLQIPSTARTQAGGPTLDLRYTYRAAQPELGHTPGWILVSREDEVSKMRQMTGPSSADALMGLPQRQPSRYTGALW